MIKITKNLLVDILIFLVLVLVPFLFIYYQVSSLSSSDQQKRFITEKLKINAKRVASEKPEIIEVINPQDYANLIFSKSIGIGDYIFIYKNSGVVIFIDKQTERIIGTGEL